MSFHQKPKPEEANIDSPTSIPTSIRDVNQRGYAILDGSACKITDIRVAGIGSLQRGIITGTNVLTNKKQEYFFGIGEKVNVPMVKITEYQLVGIDSDNFVLLMDENGIIREDLRFLKGEGQDELNEKIRKNFEADKSLVICVLTVCGKEIIMDFRESH